MATIDDIALTRGITFGSLNVRGISQKVDELSLLLDKTKLDILCVQESFLTENVLDAELNIQKYDQFRLDRDVSICKSSGWGLGNISG